MADLLEPRCEEILARWEARARDALFGDELSRSVIRDNLPDLLKRTIDDLRRQAELQGRAFTPSAAIVELAKAHGLERYRHGFDVELVQAEYRVFRDVLFDCIEESGYTPTLGEVRVVGDAITAAISEARVHR